jgi:hypothetical protein
MSDILDSEDSNLVVQLIDHAPVADTQAEPGSPG